MVAFEHEQHVQEGVAATVHATTLGGVTLGFGGAFYVLKPVSGTLVMKGLTLIEVLVVTVIIAILTAVITVAAVRSKHGARITVCASNLSSIGKAMALYAGDHDDQLPPTATYSFTQAAGGQTYAADCSMLINSYVPYGVKTTNWKCPLEPDFDGTVLYNECQDRTSYSTAGGIGALMQPIGDGWALLLSKIENPSERHYLNDTFWQTSDLVAPFRSSHDNSMSVLYFDGHVGRTVPLNPGNTAQKPVHRPSLRASR